MPETPIPLGLRGKSPNPYLTKENFSLERVARGATAVLYALLDGEESALEPKRPSLPRNLLDDAWAKRDLGLTLCWQRTVSKHF